MYQDLNYIKKEIKDCTEVDSPYDIKLGQIVKYITLEGDSEFFYPGGKYIRMGDNKIVLKVDKSTVPVNLTYIDTNGYVFYKTRLFIKDDDKEECKNKEEYEKIIATQQQIIEKLNLQLKKQTLLINKLTSNS